MVDRGEIELLDLFVERNPSFVLEVKQLACAKPVAQILPTIPQKFFVWNHALRRANKCLKERFRFSAYLLIWSQIEAHQAATLDQFDQAWLFIQRSVERLPFSF